MNNTSSSLVDARRFYLGLDAGTSVTKAALFDAAGVQVAEATRTVPLRRAHPGWSEIEPAEAIEAATDVIGSVLSVSGIGAHEIRAMGISAAMVGAWCVDHAGRALRNGIVWEDSRSQSLLEELGRDQPGYEDIVFSQSGGALQQGCTLPVMAWLARHEPHVLAACAHVFGYKDFLRMWLTGRAATDRSEAAVAPGSAVARGRSEALIELFGLAPFRHLLPTPLDPEALAGTVTAAASRVTGLPEGLPVAVGAGDVPSSIVGAGGNHAGAVTAVLGTTCLLGLTSPAPTFAPRSIGLLFTLPDHLWFRTMVNVAGTLNLDWALTALAPDLAARPDRYEAVQAMVAAAPAGAGGVSYLPYLSESGIISPVIDASARAQFAGLAPRHGRPELFRAIFEGVAFAFFDMSRVLCLTNAPITLTGGGARSPVWMQMICDTLQTEIRVPRGGQFGARGAALIAATAVGDFASTTAATQALPHEYRRYHPDPKRGAALRKAYQVHSMHRERLLGPIRHLNAITSEELPLDA